MNRLLTRLYPPYDPSYWIIFDDLHIEFRIISISETWHGIMLQDNEDIDFASIRSSHFSSLYLLFYMLLLFLHVNNSNEFFFCRSAGISMMSCTFAFLGRLWCVSHESTCWSSYVSRITYREGGTRFTEARWQLLVLVRCNFGTGPGNVLGCQIIVVR